MADSTNSSRKTLKATYVPLKLPPAAPQQPGGADAAGPSPQPNVMLKVAYIRGLNIRPAEIESLQKAPALQGLHLQPSPALQVAQAVVPRQPLIDVVKAVTTDLSPALMVTHGPLLANASVAALETLGRELHNARQTKVATAATSLTTIVRAYADSKNTAPELVDQSQALQWAVKVQHPAWATLRQLSTDFSTGPTITKAGGVAPNITSILHDLGQDASATKTHIDDFLLQFSFQPVGWLHLERLEMTPVGIEDGELVYSVPLTPKETVNITHREWSETTSTFESLVSDSFEGFSEKGVTEKSDISKATDAQTKHSSAFDVNGQVTFAYNGDPYSVTASTAVDFKTSAEDSTSIKESRAHSLAVTQLASARARKEHKQSFRVSSVAGAQDLSVRTLTNPSDSQTMRADYFRMMRRWQVDLIRYGLRMTYDLVIPNPGSSLSSKVSELAQLNQVLSVDFVFPLNPSDIVESNYDYYANLYGATLDLPPQNPGDMAQTLPLDKTDNEEKHGSIQFSVPDDYEVKSAQIWAGYSFWGDHAKSLWFGVKDGAYKPELPQIGGGDDANQTRTVYDSDDAATDPDQLFSKSLSGRSGQIIVNYMWYHVNEGNVTVTLKLTPKPATFATWQMKSWATLKQAATDQHAAALNRVRDRQAQLQKEIDSYDSLTLRRMEREEIMRMVLLWLFGPSFQLVPSVFEQLAWPSSGPPVTGPDIAFPDPSQIPAAWESVRKYGEFIKFLNNAIEWENVLFFCYPYFWDLIENWPFKRFLVHPDSDHRDFLRAGCARVVVTVRPGFETAFAGLIDYFTLPSHPKPDPKAQKTPYVTIGEEIRNYAMTNYGHIPPANPDNNVRPLLHPLQIRAWKEMQAIMESLEKYNDSKQNPEATRPYAANIYPRTVDDDGKPGLGLQALPDVATLRLNDPWGRPYVYSCPGDHGEDYDLACYGKNGNQQTSGEGLDAWITSYAEGNVVSRWFEYTPTSALDVAVTMGPPQPTLF